MARVLLAMSGGVDSSVSALLLKRAGHEVLGAFMLGGSCGAEADRPGKRGCCSMDDAADARRVADRLGIPFYPVDCRREFGRLVDYFVSEYDRGATPNPCILCNRDLKFGRLLEVAENLGARMVATGHYARVERRGDRRALLRGADRLKDQSYVLFALSPRQLERALFPVGALRKEEVRRLAREAGLEVAGKEESQEICFVPRGDHRRLLAERLGDRLRPGEFRSRDGRLLGRHPGYQLFTVGQRKGLGRGFGRPMYVAAIRPGDNTVVLSEEDERRREFCVRAANWLSGGGPARGGGRPDPVRPRRGSGARGTASRGTGARDLRGTAAGRHPRPGRRLLRGRRGPGRRLDRAGGRLNPTPRSSETPARRERIRRTAPS